MYPLVLLIAGIVLLFNAGWFHGASVVGAILVGVGALATLWTLFVLRLAGRIIKEVKGPGSPRFPQTRTRRRL